MEIFDILKIPSQSYFLTGSRALDTEKYQFSTSSSDYDYVVDIHYRRIILGYLSAIFINVELSCYNGGFKFCYQDKIYNIITCIDIEFLVWKNALNILKSLIDSNNCYAIALKNKLNRYSFYEMFRGILKLMYSTGNNNA